MSEEDVTHLLVAEILRDTHRYAGGVGQNRPTVVTDRTPAWRRALRYGGDVGRDLLERAAGRAGFSHRHFDPDAAARRLERLFQLSEGLNSTYALLGDERSRRAFIDVLKLRVLGPYHSPLAITPEMYRAKQRYVDREMRRASSTIHVSDPWFSPLSLYEAPVACGAPVALHSHSVDLVSVFLLGQYTYAHGGSAVRAEPGDVVLDVGGCWGDTALYFASRVGPTGKVYTFEFDPESLGVLRANLALNPELEETIEVIEVAFWDTSGASLEFAQAGRSTTVLETHSGNNAGEVVSVTIDDFVERVGFDRLDFIKMDVEGAELKVLSGAGDSLKRFAPKLAIAAYHKDDDLVRIPEALDAAALGYRLFVDSFSPLEEETVLFAAQTASGH